MNDLIMNLFHIFSERLASVRFLGPYEVDGAYMFTKTFVTLKTDQTNRYKKLDQCTAMG